MLAKSIVSRLEGKVAIFLGEKGSAHYLPGENLCLEHFWYFIFLWLRPNTIGVDETSDDVSLNYAFDNHMQVSLNRYY